ncbi:MAG: putative quinol monooxygenase [Solirubrobacterales bacterium]
MSSMEIGVTYQWTAKEGKMDELRALYEAVAEQSKAEEPGIPWMNVYEVQGSDALIISEVFEDGAALGTHLGGTAAQHFPTLSEIADFGPFFVFGDVPDELAQAASGMGATLATRAFGFTRS